MRHSPLNAALGITLIEDYNLNVFISWSGEKSKLVAELLDDWLQCVLQAIDPWMSSKDIDRGALWFSEISNQLEHTSLGIICLTQENKTKPWILFEAGALAKGLSENRVCTFLIDLEPTDIGTPLSQFNHTFPNRDGVWELVRTINGALKENALKERILEKVFDTYWQQFEEKFQQIATEHPKGEKPIKRSEDEILLEILSSTRSMEKRIRSLEKLEKHSDFAFPKRVCPKCGDTASTPEEVESMFGFTRLSNGAMRVQSHCKDCRSFSVGPLP